MKINILVILVLISVLYILSVLFGVMREEKLRVEVLENKISVIKQIYDNSCQINTRLAALKIDLDYKNEWQSYYDEINKLYLQTR